MDDQYLEEDPPDYEQYAHYEGTSESIPYVVVSLQPDGAAVVESVVGASHYEVVREKTDFVELFERVCIFCRILCFLFFVLHSCGTAIQAQLICFPPRLTYVDSSSSLVYFIVQILFVTNLHSLHLLDPTWCNSPRWMK